MKVRLLVLAAGAAYAQSGLGACDAPGARRPVTPQMLAESPDDVFLNRRYLESRAVRPGSRASEYRDRLARNPDDPRLLYFYGLALLGADTPQAIRQLERAIELAPEFPLPYLALAQLYGSGDFKNGTKAGKNLLVYSGLCPASLEGYTSLGAVTDRDTLRELTARFRKAIEGRSTIGVAQEYPRLWAAEFRAADSAGFDRLRAQVRKDVERAKELNPQNTQVLAQGYKLLGDTEAAKALPAAAPPPTSGPAVIAKWLSDHPYPSSGGEEAKERWRDARHAAARQWVKDWPDEPNAWYWLMVTTLDRKPVDERALAEAGDQCLAAAARRPDVWGVRPDTLSVAELWVRGGIRLTDAVALAEKAVAEIDGGPAFQDDRRRGEREAFRKSAAPMLARSRMDALATQAEGWRKLGGLPSARRAVERMRTWLDEHPGERQAGVERVYLEQEALQAVAEGHKADALAFYAKARWEARARDLWAELGGSRATFEMWWSRPTTATVAERPSEKWTAMEKSLASLRASDLAGRPWTVADFQGKATFINVWATWCAPCRAELPQVQKLYEQTKDRRDLQVITIAIDENPGVVPPFMAENHFTFPVVLAKGLVDEVMPQISSPRNWIADRDGRLRAELIGYDSRAVDWPAQMLGEISKYLLDMK